MKRITTFIILLSLCVDCLAQSPEQTVRQYVRLLNDWLASPYSADKQKNVLNILNGGESAMKDEIVENFNSDAGKKHTSPGNYLAIFYEKTTANRVKVEIVSLKAKTDDGEKYVTAVLKYSGGISLTTAADFWIKGGKITGIVSNEREIARLSSSASQAKTAVSPPVQNNTNATPSIVQQPQPSVSENEHEWVDLGLPSGTLWATCNVGANNPWEYGDFFAWGETDGKKSKYAWSKYKYANGKFDKLTKYCNKSSFGNNGFTDSRITLEPSDDAATANWGSDWCLPTLAQIEELFDNCTDEWTTNYQGKGVVGRIFKSKKNGNTIFFPAAGRKWNRKTSDFESYGSYWSRSFVAFHPTYAWHLRLNSSGADYNCSNRCGGRTVRPVRCSN